MRLTVVIATRDRKDVLRESLQRYATGSLADVEIIVVDNGSTDQTTAMLEREFPHVRTVRLADNIGPAALNLAAELATGDVIFRTDDDAWPETDDMLERGLRFMEAHPEIDLVAGEVYFVDNGLTYNWYPFPERTATIPEHGLPVNHFCGASVLIRKKAFLQVGGFWDTFYIEESDLSARMIAAGMVLRYVPWFRVCHRTAFQPSQIASRWLLMSTMPVRFNFRYFPFWRATGRSMVHMASQMVIGIWHRTQPLTFLEGILGMLTTGLRAWRAERQTLTRDQLRMVTMGENVWVTTWRYYRFAFKRLRARWSKSN
jgi:GT2 family glycosyltransferase